MNYPNLEEVEHASLFDLCKWQRFLPSPGMNVIGQPEFEDTMQRESTVMARIIERSRELGGFTPEISKALGWMLEPILPSEWSGSLCPIAPDTCWIDDVTGEHVNAHTGQRTPECSHHR